MTPGSSSVALMTSAIILAGCDGASRYDVGGGLLVILLACSALFFTGYGIYWIVMKLLGKEPRKL